MAGKFGCPLCNGSGIVVGEFGVEIECECVREMREEAQQNKQVASNETTATPNIFGELSNDDKIIQMKLVPAHRIKDEFSSNHVRIVAVQVCSKLKRSIGSKSDMDRYISTLETILSELRYRRLPKKSYIFGAPNGFGKTTFATTAIKIMATNGMKAVPLITLTELAEKWAEANDNIRRKLEHKDSNGKEKTVTDDDGEDVQFAYDWYDYVNADMPIVSLSSINENTMWIETQCLRQLLQLRDRKGKPTIVLTSESLDWYKNNEAVSKYMMDHLIEAQADERSWERKEFGNDERLYKTVENRLDKLEHISVYLIPIKK